MDSLITALIFLLIPALGAATSVGRAPTFVDDGSEYLEEAEYREDDAGFTFACDGNEAAIPCAYAEFIAATGLELRSSEGTPDPDERCADDWRSKEEADLYIPGTDISVMVSLHAASYRLDENGGHILLKGSDGQQLFEAETFGGCEVYRVGLNCYDWNDVDQAARCTFMGGVRLGQTREEILDWLGEPYKAVSNGSVDYVVYLDGDQVLTVGFRNGSASSIEMDFDAVFAARR